MKTIQPVIIWDNGQNLEAKILKQLMLLGYLTWLRLLQLQVKPRGKILELE